MSAEQTVHTPFEYLCDWSAAKFDNHGYDSLASFTQPLVYWSKPPLNFHKCNIDTAIFQEQRKIGIGMIL